MSREITDIEDLYEDEKIVLMKETDTYGSSHYAVGIKDKSGDIVAIQKVRNPKIVEFLD